MRFSISVMGGLVVAACLLAAPVTAGAASGPGADTASSPSLASVSPSMDIPEERKLLESIRKRERELDMKAEALRDERERLQELRRDVESAVERLEEKKASLERLTKEIEAVKDERIQRLVKIYASMSPEEAAPRIEELDKEVAVLILASMRPSSAGKILGLVNVEKSVSLSQSLRLTED